MFVSKNKSTGAPSKAANKTEKQAAAKGAKASPAGAKKRKASPAKLTQETAAPAMKKKKD